MEKETKRRRTKKIQETLFQKDLKYLESNKNKIIRKQEENNLKIIPSDNPNLKFIKLKKILFNFDKEGFDLFQENFNKEPYELNIKKELYKNGEEAFYLLRENKHTGKIHFFHRWLMEKELKDFCLEHNYKQNEVVIHHINFNSKMNEKNNLLVMTKIEHDKLHNRI